MFPIPLRSLNDQQRHDYILQTFVLNKAAATETRRHKRDIDVIKDHHRFLWDDEDQLPSDAAPSNAWETRLARRYYDKLFKEYCIADLSRHKDNKVALRWRTEAEVVAGKGQFQCGSRNCEQRDTLRSWEVNFAYQEQGARKNALVKLRLCPEHSAQLNYTSRKREVKRLKHVERQRVKETKRRLRRQEKGGQEEVEDADCPAVSECGDCEDATGIDQNAETSVEAAQVTDEQEDITVADSEDVWSKKTEVEAEPNSRENDFERYLEDLLL